MNSSAARRKSITTWGIVALKDYQGSLQDLLVGLVELEGLLEVQVRGGQRDGEVDSTHEGEDGVLRQGLQRHACVLENNTTTKG